MPFTQNTDLEMYYELSGPVEGTTERVLFIGGTGGDLRVKPNVLDGPLPKAVEILAYDQRGLGRTEKPDSAYSIEQYADDAVNLMDELGWESANIVGVSFGGMVALNLVLRHPDRVRKLVLCCTSPGGDKLASYPLHEIPRDLGEEERIRKMMSISDTRLDDAWRQANPKKFRSMIDMSLSMPHADQKLPEFKMGAIRQLEARSQHNVVDRLKDISIPTLICAGRYDGLAPVENQQAMCDLIPGARLRWFEGGHMFLIQDKDAWPFIISFLAND
jgi:3-oxoadipate enol-lactonase